MQSKLAQFFLWLIGIIVLVAIAIQMENHIGIPVAVTFRVVAASACLFVMFKCASDYPGEQWPRFALFFAVIINIAMFFSPLSKLSPSKGDILFFALPDIVVWLAARTYSYPVTDAHQRAVRQQLIAGLVLSVAFCAIFLSILLVPSPTAH